MSEDTFMSPRQREKLSADERLRAKELLEKDLEGMLALVFIQRRETDAALLREMQLLSDKMDDLCRRVSTVESRIRETNAWIEQVNFSVTNAVDKRGGSEKLPRSSLSTRVQMPARRNFSRGKESDANLPLSPRTLIRQRSMDSSLTLNTKQNGET